MLIRFSDVDQVGIPCLEKHKFVSPYHLGEIYA